MDKLRAMLLARGIKQNWLAAEIGMDQSLLSHILAGRRPPPAGFYTKVARALRVRVNAIKPASSAPTEPDQLVAEPSAA